MRTAPTPARTSVLAITEPNAPQPQTSAARPTAVAGLLRPEERSGSAGRSASDPAVQVRSCFLANAYCAMRGACTALRPFAPAAWPSPACGRGCWRRSHRNSRVMGDTEASDSCAAPGSYHRGTPSRVARSGPKMPARWPRWPGPAYGSAWSVHISCRTFSGNAARARAVSNS